MEIKILGPGCKHCMNLEKSLMKAVILAGIDAKITNVSDFAEIARYGVLKPPGLVINERVVVSGRVPSEEEIIELIQSYQEI